MFESEDQVGEATPRAKTAGAFEAPFVSARAGAAETPDWHQRMLFELATGAMTEIDGAAAGEPKAEGVVEEIEFHSEDDSDGENAVVPDS
ncbi:MAG: hypothetical protein AAFU55_11500, partial [Pseudomonadota bacterium]